jgi:hypothetical protein
MRNNPENDSNLALALGLLGATIVAALVVLVLPAIAGWHFKPEPMPRAEIITSSEETASDNGPVFQRLPKAQRPPEALLNPVPDSGRALVSKD